MENRASEWKTLSSIEQFKNILDSSGDKPIIIFKHSIHCSTSTLVKMDLLAKWGFESELADFYQLDIINHFDVSSDIVTKLGVEHQSPQIIMIKNKKATYRSSHLDISYDSIKKAIEGKI